MRLFPLLASVSAIFSPFTPIFEEAVKYGKIGFLQVLEDVNSANWNDTEIFPASKNARTVLTDAFLSDVNNTTPSQIVNWLMDFDYNLMKNGFAHSQGHDFLTWEDFERALDDIFDDQNYDTDPEAFSDLIFDESDSGLLSLEREESLLLAIDSFLAACDVLHHVFILDLENPSQMLLDFLNFGFTWYSELDQVFELDQSSYIGIAVSGATFAFQTTTSIQEINKDYNGRIGSIDFCGTDFSALDYFERYVLYADFALPKTMQIFDEAMIFWNLLCQEIPLLMNSSLDFSAALIPDMYSDLVNDYFESAKRSINEFQVMARLFEGQINNFVKNTVC